METGMETGARLVCLNGNPGAISLSVCRDGNRGTISLSVLGGNRLAGGKPARDWFVYQSDRWMESAQLACRLGRRLARFPWAAFRTNGLLQPEIIYRFPHPLLFALWSSALDAHRHTV